MLPGEIVTTFSPAPGCDGGGVDGASSVRWGESEPDGVVPAPPLPITGALARPLPEAGPVVLAAQLPLEPTLRKGRGGTFGIGLFWSVIDSLSASTSGGGPGSTA